MNSSTNTGAGLTLATAAVTLACFFIIVLSGARAEQARTACLLQYSIGRVAPSATSLARQRGCTAKSNQGSESCESAPLFHGPRAGSPEILDQSGLCQKAIRSNTRKPLDVVTPLHGVYQLPRLDS